MKKIISIITALVLLFSVVSTANATVSVTLQNTGSNAKTMVTFSPDSRELEVSGNNVTEQKGAFVMVFEMTDGVDEYEDITHSNISDVLFAIRQIVPVDGAFSYEITLPEEIGDSGKKYIVSIGHGVGEDALSTTIYNPSTVEKETAISVFSNATGTELQNAFEEYSIYNEDSLTPFVTLNITSPFYTGNKNSVTAAFESYRAEEYADGFTLFEDVEKAFNNILGLMVVNGVEDSELPGVLVTYNSVFELDLENAEYVADSAKFCKLMRLQTEAIEKKFSSIIGLQNAFAKAIVITKINAANRDEIEGILSDYPEYFSDLSYGTASKSEVTKALWKKDFKTIEKIKEKFRAAVKGNGGGGSPDSDLGPDDKNLTDTPILPPSEPVIPPASTTQKFNDIENYTWAHESINALYDMNIISGYEDGGFRPGNVVKREEFVKMMVLGFDIPVGSSDSVLSDIDNGAWYAPYVNAAFSAGIVNGQSETIFGIGNGLTREDAACIIYRVLTRSGKQLELKENVEFADADLISDYAKEAVTYLAKSGIISGKDGNRFAAKDYITRAETAKIIYYTISLLK